MGLTNDKALKEVMKLYNLCFDANSLCDRISYIISIQKNAIEFGDWFHHNIAHYFTGDALADGIEAFGELRGDLFYRDVVPKHDETYGTYAQMMEAFTMKVADIEKQCVLALKVSAEQGSESYEDYLRDVNKNSITPLMKQATVLYNMVSDYELNGAAYKINKDFKHWIIPEFRKDGD